MEDDKPYWGFLEVHITAVPSPPLTAAGWLVDWT